jgi:dipeptide/tripeptide permease
VADRELARVASTFQVASAAAQLVATIAAGLLAEAVGLRLTAFLAPVGGLLAAAILYWSPVRHLRELPVMDERRPAEVAFEIERDQPVGA